ncbi:MAG: PDC sensor domain-containing protein [Gammaproteobacteria bacterium]
MSEPLQDAISRQRDNLREMLTGPLASVARKAAFLWPDKAAMDEALETGFHTIPYCKYLYAMSAAGEQISANISAEGRLEADFGRDRSQRPYMAEVVPAEDFLLSESYISMRAHRPSLTAVQVVRDTDNRVLGFIGADFDLRDLPLTQPLYKDKDHWRQIKGDPAIRGNLFAQTRFESVLDQHIDEVLPLMEELVLDHGVFHYKIHYSSSRATIMTMQDPYRYRILEAHELIDPDTALAYPHRPYPADATIPADAIPRIMQTFKRLRFMDETIYLRSSTVNIFNGTVALTFSCDGSHYMPWGEFLEKDLSFWEGTSTLN